MTKSERLNELTQLQNSYDNQISELVKEIAKEEITFEKYSQEVKANRKKCDRRMTLAGIMLSGGLFLSSFVIPLTGANPFICALTIGFMVYAGVNGVVQWIKSDKSDKQVEELKKLEIENYSKVLTLKEQLAILEQKKFKTKYAIEKLTKNISSQKSVMAKQVETNSVDKNAEITK